jgi:hypothetical protein
MIALNLIEQITRQGRASSILHVQVDPTAPPKSDIQLVDAYKFPDGYYVTTPQFVPARGSQGQTNGYIVCIVHYGDRDQETNGNELWIFDACNLHQGPICQLWHPKFKIGFTVHSTWIPQAEPRTAPYTVPVREDYASIVKQQSPEVQDLFENWIYPKKFPHQS